jgi:hypothetical protein
VIDHNVIVIGRLGTHAEATACLWLSPLGSQVAVPNLTHSSNRAILQIEAAYAIFDDLHESCS